MIIDMKKFFLPFVLLAILVIIIGGVLLSSKQEKQEPLPLPSSYEYFWGDGCPHCAVVEEFLNSWEKKDLVKIEKKEVWKNAANAKYLEQRAESCGYKPSEIAVPFLFTPEGKCLVGDKPIITFFETLEI